MFEKQGVTGLLLLNLEATLLVFLTSVVSFAVISALANTIFQVESRTDVEKLNFITKQIHKKKESFLWDALPR